MKSFNLLCASGLIVGIGSISACKPRNDQTSHLEDLNKGEYMNYDENTPEKMKKGRKVVVIYYANDTFAPRLTDPAYENLHDLTELLETAAAKETDKAVSEQLRKLSNRLQHDWDYFNRSVNSDVQILSSRLCSAVGPNYEDSVAGLAVFRNSTTAEDVSVGGMPTSKYLRDLSWQYCRRGDKALRPESFQIPYFREFPYDSQPYSNSATFELALQSVKAQFNPQEHRFILITKSHGSKDSAVVPHLSVDLRERIRKDPEKVLTAIKNGTSTTTGLDSFKSDTILDGIDEILKTKLSNTSEKGISKIEYLRILNSLGQVSTSSSDAGAGDSRRAILKDGPMMFPIVLMEACKSELSASTDEEIKGVLNSYGQEGKAYAGFSMHNVGLLYTSDQKGLGYDEIGYAELLGWLANRTTDFQDLFMTLLDSKTAKGSGNSDKK